MALSAATDDATWEAELSRVLPKFGCVAGIRDVSAERDPVPALANTAVGSWCDGAKLLQQQDGMRRFVAADRDAAHSAMKWRRMMFKIVSAKACSHRRRELLHILEETGLLQYYGPVSRVYDNKMLKRLKFEHLLDGGFLSHITFKPMHVTKILAHIERMSPNERGSHDGHDDGEEEEGVESDRISVASGRSSIPVASVTSHESLASTSMRLHQRHSSPTSHPHGVSSISSDGTTSWQDDLDALRSTVSPPAALSRSSDTTASFPSHILPPHRMSDSGGGEDDHVCLTGQFVWIKMRDLAAAHGHWGVSTLKTDKDSKYPEYVLGRVLLAAPSGWRKVQIMSEIQPGCFVVDASPLGRRGLVTNVRDLRPADHITRDEEMGVWGEFI